MGKQLNRKNADVMLERIDELQPGSMAAWGKLSVSGMMYHYVTVTKEIPEGRADGKRSQPASNNYLK